MGAALGCYRGGPDPDVVMAKRYMHHDVHGAKRSSSYAKLTPSGSGGESVLGKLQRTLSLSLMRSRTEASGGGIGGGYASAVDLTGSLFSHGEDGGDMASWGVTRSQSSASGTTGSRMLSDFYNLVLESERNTFFKDKHGKRVKGAYLDEILIIDDYFGPISRKRQRGHGAAQKPAMLEPKLPIMDRFAHLPTALMSTTSTISSEMDYWSCLDSMSMDQDDTEIGGKKLTRRYDSSLASSNGQLLFSPMHVSGSDSARRMSKSLSPHNGGWNGYDIQFNEDDDDDEEEDLGSQSAYGYNWDQLRHPNQHQHHTHHSHHQSHKKLDPMPSSSSTTSSGGSSSRPPIYFTPDAARNAGAVAPMMAS